MKNKNIRLILLLLLSQFFLGEMKAVAGKARLYIATDKDIYTSSELIQFQIFLLNTSNSNKSVYAELLDCKGNKLTKKMLPLTSSISWGNLKVPQTDSSAFYILYCYVISKDSVEIDCHKKIYIQTNASSEKTETGKEAIIDFAAEGGTFVALMPNKLLISFKDEFGKPLEGSGKITDIKNYETASFTIDQSGYATVTLKPDFDTRYFIVIKNKDGRELRKELPAVSNSGVNLTVTVKKDSLTYTAYSLTSNYNQLDYKLNILLNDKTIYKSDINFVAGFSIVQETISLKDLQTGFLTFRLSDLKDNQYAQRVIYLPAENREYTSLKITDTINNKSATVSIPGYVSGYSYLNILRTNAATETGITNFKDRLEQPVIYNNPGKEISMNDVLIAMKNQPPATDGGSINENPFLTLQGTAYSSENKPLKNQKLNLIFAKKNLKKEYKVVTTDRGGNFEIGSLIFFDTVKVYYQLADNSDGKNDIRVDLRVVPATHFSGNAEKYLRFACMSNTPDTNKFVQTPEMIITPDASVPKGKTLKEVTVSGRKPKAKTETQRFIEENVSAQNNQTNLLRSEFDFIANPQVIDSRPILEFLRGRMSLNIQISAKGDVKISTLSGESIGVYLDDMDISSDLDMIAYLPVRDVALVRFYSLPLKPKVITNSPRIGALFGNTSGDGGDLMIYTKRGFTPTELPVKGLPKTIIAGYDADDTITSLPIASPLQNVYWKPNWIPQKEEIIKIGLLNSNPSEQIQLIIEGINKEQEPFTFTKNLIFN